MEEILLSIIVPIYNTSEYLEKCINSILNQSYNNFEIILVDDGSTDNSGSICDNYKKKYSNINVVHKKNGGLSSARNAGIATANGEFITFIDSDDEIDKDIYSIVFSKAPLADITVFSIERIYMNGYKSISMVCGEKSLSNIEGLIYLNTFKNLDLSCCNKIFRRELFNDIIFPINKKSEDYFIMYKLFDEAKSIKIIPNVGYYYMQRDGSISRNKLLNMDYIDGAQSQIDYFKINHKDILYVAESDFAFANKTLFLYSIKEDIKDIANKKILFKNSKIYKNSVLKNKYINFDKKVKYLLFIYFNKIYCFVYKLLKGK